MTAPTPAVPTAALADAQHIFPRRNVGKVFGRERLDVADQPRIDQRLPMRPRIAISAGVEAIDLTGPRQRGRLRVTGGGHGRCLSFVGGRKGMRDRGV
jgi:hypothetical protein